MASKTLHFRYKGIEFLFEIDQAETIISGSIEKSGVWEPYQLDLYDSLVPAGGIFVDIGANVGINSIYVKEIQPTARVIAIEASRENFQLLSRNIKHRGIHGYHLAIADRDGNIGFSGSGTNAKISSGSGDQVPCRRLDTFLQEEQISWIDLLKIDVEGFTDVVLAGASNALAVTRSVIIEFSIHDVIERYHCDLRSVQGYFSHYAASMSKTHPHIAYISRKDGLVRFSDMSDLMEMLSIEHGVGDVLFTKEEQPNSITGLGFAIRKIHELMAENHRRIEDNQRVRSMLDELYGNR